MFSSKSILTHCFRFSSKLLIFPVLSGLLGAQAPANSSAGPAPSICPGGAGGPIPSAQLANCPVMVTPPTQDSWDQSGNRDSSGNVPPDRNRLGMDRDETGNSRPANPMPLHPPQKSEFQIYAEDAAGQRLQVYGSNLFERVPTTFAPTDFAPVPANYVLGPGDQLQIRMWGKVALDTRVRIDRSGQIFIPRVGALRVAGLRYEQVESYLRAAIGNFYKDFDLNVTMGQLRSIQIYVLGEARQPGTYTVSSLSTLVNALFASGGPSATGSMRRIELRRANKVVREFDVYDLLRHGDTSGDVALLPEDVIYIPAVGPQVVLFGSVNEPGIYEMKDGETVASLLNFAGGMTSLAAVNRAMLERVEHHERRVDDFPLDETGLHRVLQAGDILKIFPISPKLDDTVTLRGNVASPGHYRWRAGMRIADLIQSRQMLLTRDYWNLHNYLPNPADREARQSVRPAAIGNFLPGNDSGGAPPRSASSHLRYGIPAQETNGLQGVSKIEEDDEASQDTRSRNPFEHWDRPDRYARTTTPDPLAEIADAGTEINWSYAAIERLDDKDLSTRLIPFNLGNAIDHPGSEDDQVLHPGDIITVFAQRDIPLPQDRHAAFVRISGEVNAPGIYRIGPGETLRSLVARAGGLTSRSYLYASQLTRESTRIEEEEQLRISISQMQRDLSSRFASASSTPSAGSSNMEEQMRTQQAAIAQLGAIQPTGRIVLDMNPRASAVADIPDLPLEDGDSYYVPPRFGTVQVNGAVFNANAFRYQPGKRIATYLSDAGGPTRQADKARIFLIRADGTVVSRQGHASIWGRQFENLTLLPGDAIVVPTKLKAPGSFMQQLPFVTQILSQTAMTGAVIGTAY